MANRKSTTLTIRIDPVVKEGLRNAAEREYRSITNMIEILIRAHCAREGIRIPRRASTPRAQDRY